MSKTKILKCGCVQKFQDKKYGKNKRVFNHCTKLDKWRCTVCGAMKG